MSQFTFKRPDNLVFPQVYHRFQAKSRDFDELVNYVIKNLPEDRFEEATEMTVKIFLGDETVCSIAGLADRPLAVEESRSYYKTSFNLKLSIACFCETNDELVAVNVMKILSRDDPKVEWVPEDEADKKAVYALFLAEQAKVDPFTMFNVDSYLWGSGLVVDSRYSRRGIATEMLRARVPLMQALGLKLTSTIFSSFKSQKAAKSANFREINSRSYEERMVALQCHKVFPFDSVAATKSFNKNNLVKFLYE